MKAIMISVLTICSMATQLYAGGDVVPMENTAPSEVVEAHTEHETHGPFYVIVKGLTISGDTAPHGDTTLDGDRGYGFGIDVGYLFGNGFALEYDFSYATNTVTETDEHHHSEEANGKYYTHALDILYAYHLSHTVGIFVKAGYEYEIEKIKDFHIDSDNHGLNFGFGVEFTINDHYRFVAEAEKSNIDGPRGNSLFAGVMYIF